MIWKHAFDKKHINSISQNTMVSNIGIEFTEIGEDYLVAKMPVDHRTIQPQGRLHGGASAALAETLGSVAGMMCLDNPNQKMVVGVELNCSHVRGVSKGYVYGKAFPLKLGRTLQVWQIETTNEQEKLICVSRLTLAVVEIG